MPKVSFMIALLMTLSIAVCAGADNNWHHWRGPMENGYVPDANPPVKWDENTNIKWKVEIGGEGTSTPIVWGDKVFVTSAVKTDKVKEGSQPPAEESGDRRPSFGGGPAPTNYYQFVVTCYSLNDGSVIWSQVATEEVPHEGHHQTGSFASGSPVTDGKNLYVTFGSRGIYCYDLDGNQKWKKDLGDMKILFSFGEGTSLEIEGNSLIVNWDHEEQSFIACLNAENGETIWREDRDERTTWNTPLVTEYDGVTQVIVNAANRVRSYDLATGNVIWECGGQTSNPIPTTVRYKDLALCMSGFRGAALYAIPLNAKGDITGTDQVKWKYTKDTSYVPSALLYDNRLYFLKTNDPLVTCLNADDGSVLIEAERLPIRGNIYASPVGAAGHVYIASREGDTLVMKHGDTFEEVSVNKLDDGFDASPVVVGNQLLMRGMKNLYCIQEM